MSRPWSSLGFPAAPLQPANSLLSEPSGGLEFFQLVGDDVIYSNAHIAKVWTLEPTALSDARQALVNIRAGKELRDRFEGKTAADVEEQVRQLEAEFRSGSESDGQAQPEAGPEEPAVDTPKPAAEGQEQVGREGAGAGVAVGGVGGVPAGGARL